MTPAILAGAVLILAALPLVLGLVNLTLYRRLPPAPADAPPLTVLIPARNEEARIAPVLRALLADPDPRLRVIVGDDNSTDATAAIVRDLANGDARLRLLSVPPLPAGWKGKNHACFVLSKEVATELALFLDADVTVEPGALARIAAHLGRDPDLGLSSGFPRLLTGSFAEALLIPLIHVVLLGYLPLSGMLFTRRPMFGTACGQLIAVRIAAYRAMGGHEAIRDFIHDGVQLPRVIRRAGFRTDLFDATDLAATRMYETVDGLVEGLLKNAHEGMATPRGLPVWTVLLGGGHVLPPFVLACALGMGAAAAASLAALATACAYGFRFILTARFRQSWTGALFHPLGVAFLLAIQWTALLRQFAGKSVTWRGRSYGS